MCDCVQHLCLLLAASDVTDGGRGTNFPPGKLHVKTEPTLGFHFGFSVRFFSRVFSGDLGYYYGYPHPDTASFLDFSECCLVDSLPVVSETLSARSPLAKISSYTTACSTAYWVGLLKI